MENTWLVRDEVVHALQRKRPIVALETAVVTHGLPDPENLRAVECMETTIRGLGAIPATCLVLAGQLIVGATREEIERVAADPTREKASVRDLGLTIASGVSAGLTVSATLFAAARAGIQVFATGGIGGVHVPSTAGDVSADLLQLSRSPVITVCSGAKSVLDIPRTLEFLETAGVPVVGYRTDRFPAFYLTDSGQQVPCLPSAVAVAVAASTAWSLGSEAGMVVGNPIPEKDAIEPALWNRWIEAARQRAERERVSGKSVTPYLLAHVAESSVGRTVRANIALLENNARVAAEIALALHP
jgi:pseudouridine-5'-phosphate glycosidase